MTCFWKITCNFITCHIPLTFHHNYRNKFLQCKDRIHSRRGTLRIPSYAVWSHERAINVPTIYVKHTTRPSTSDGLLGRFDSTVYSKTKEQHLSDLDRVLSVLNKFNLKISSAKCQFARTEVKLLGFLVSGQGYSTRSPGRRRQFRTGQHLQRRKHSNDSWDFVRFTIDLCMPSVVFVVVLEET